MIPKKGRIKQSLKGLSQAILETIIDLGELIPRPLEGKQQYVLRLRKSQFYAPAYSVNAELKRLKRNGLIEGGKNKKKISYKLTLSGYQKILARKIKPNLTKLKI